MVGRVSAAWPEPDRALFSISVAAELSGLHAQTLRVYEREGLLEPARTPGGTRRYSGNEIDRLREIAALVDDGVNIAGMRRVLNLEQRIRHLQAEVSGVEALKQEARRLKAELALATGPSNPEAG
jgi:MerR family transcriptional regulator, heat shock protein HspR